METATLLLPNELKRKLDLECNSHLKCFCLNTQPAVNKTTDLELLFDQFGALFDIVMFTETWYTDNSDVFRLPSYDTYVLNRTSKRGGGLAVLVKDCIDCNLLSDYSFITKDVEVLCLRNNRNIFAVFYRPPDGNVSAFFKFFEIFLEYVNENQYNVICGGDFNIDMFSDSVSQREMKSLISMHGCVNTITDPTRVTLHSTTVLDLFITNFHIDQIKSGVLSCNLSDHLPVFLCVKVHVSRKTVENQPIVFQNIHINSLEAFRRDVASTIWNTILFENTADCAYEIFLEKILKLYKHHFPYKIKNISKKIRKPWVTFDLVRKIRKKDIFYKRFLKTRP